MKISIGSSRKRYQHDMSYHIDTTSDFGSCQPILCQYLNSGDSVRMQDFRQLVRNGVMPSPTFGDIKCANTFRFVPMCEIFPAFDALLSSTPVRSSTGENYTPVSVPLISNVMLVALLSSSFFADVTFYDVVGGVSGQTATYKLKILSGSQLESVLFSWYSTSFGLPSFEALQRWVLSNDGVRQFFSQVSDTRKLVTIDGADFVFRGKFSGTEDTLLCVRLNNRGRRLYKLLKGLGFSLDVNDGDPVSVLPCLAFYKAWFDTYAVQRTVTWHSTTAYGFINYVYNNPIGDMSDGNSNSALHLAYFCDFLLDFSQDCFYSYQPDYFSVQTSKVLNISNNPSSIGDIVTVQPDGSTMNPLSMSNLPYLKRTEDLTKIKLDVLTRVSRFLTKNSLIGGKVYDYVRVHFGAGVADDMFAQSGHIATLITDIKLDDFYSSSDTFSSESQDGRFLGSRAGVGQGFSNNSFSFSAKNFGFVIGMCAIYPNSFYCQGDDPQLFMRRRFDFPSADFDGLGYELTPLSTVYDTLGLSVSETPSSFTGKGFGFAPRYSMYKYKKNILNGDMILRSTRDSFAGFHLDRLIVPQEISVEPLADTNASGSIVFPSSDVPLASEAWRFLLKYPFLSNPNRIFLNTGSVSDFSGISNTRKRYDDVMNDNFTVQCNCSFYVYNQLKPLSHSYDTFDSNDTTASEVTPS